MSPFTTKAGEMVRSAAEIELIRRIQTWLAPVSPPPPEGIGDDAAVIPFPSGERLLLTTDPVVLGLHFEESTPPETVSAKLLKRNLSDIAAMGGKPLAGVLSLFLPPNVSLSWLECFHTGLANAAKEFGVHIDGGDICQTDGFLGASLALTGTTVNGRTTTRSGAESGDRIYVTGKLGGSLLGRHLSFTPRLAEGGWLGQRREVKAMVDVSDGLAKDLPQIVPSGCQAVIDVPALPLHPDAFERERLDGVAPAAHALTDGEDYELLFAVDGGADHEEFEREWKRRFPLDLNCIGNLITRKHDSEPPLVLSGDETISLSSLRGYEHFR